MNRPPVCHYYQAGHCRNGDLCPFTHPTVRCREFSSTGWCPYGFHCHFWHDRSQTFVSTPHSRKPCTFFANGQCKYGEKCTFSHDLEWDAGSKMTLAEYRASQRSSQVTFTNRSKSPRKTPLSSATPVPLTNLNRYISGSESFIRNKSTLSGRQPSLPRGDTGSGSRPPMLRPNSHLVLNGTNKSEICRLQNLEINRLIMCYPSDKLHEVDSTGDGRMFFLRFSSTDPDWAYDVREIVLSIHVVRMYPVEPLKISVLAKDYLPHILIEHLNMAIQSWITHRHKQIRQNNRTEIYLRQFLLWLDRNLENLFTQGLRKFKAQLDEERDLATTTTVQPSDTSAPTNSTRDRSDADVPKVAIESHSVSSNENVEGNGDNDDLSEGASTQSASHESNAPDAESSKSSDVEEVEGEWVEPVYPQTKLNAEEQKDVLDPLLIKPESRSAGVSKASQYLKLIDFQLHGKAGTVVQRRLSATLHCTRCRLPFTWIFTLGYNPAQGTEFTSSPEQLRSVPPNTARCARCRQQMSLLFQADMMHSFSNTTGSFRLDGCVADDIPPKISEFLISCVECNKIVKLSNVEAGRRVNKYCTVCHSLVGLEFSSFRLEMVAVTNEQGPNNSQPRAQTSEAEKPSRKERHAANRAQNQLIQDGLPLPFFGTCKHYRKSNRWLRFPCCGRAEPCDVCHDQAATDGHEMELATRMICGFCAKEQPVSSTKPCIRCGKHLSGSRSAHWEGGKGCRDQTTMSRKDVKKYSQLNKTVSRSKSKV